MKFALLLHWINVFLIGLFAYGLKARQHGYVFLWLEDTSHGYASPSTCWFLLLTCPIVHKLHLVMVSILEVTLL